MPLILLLLMLAPPALAEGLAPKPRLRPTEPAREEAVSIPLPRPRPGGTTPEVQAPPPLPAPPVAQDDAAVEPGPRGWSPAEVAAARARCRTLLEGLDIDAAPLDPIGESGGCGAPAPVRVSRVAGVALTPDATLTCEMAAALHGWVSGAVKPAARQRLKTEVTSIRTATSYACRRRNNSSSGKMSEHSKANGLDMAGFVFAAEEKGVAVGGGNWGEGLLAALGVSGQASFLEEVQKAACGYFTTVLGPGSDAFHGDHFHVDVLQRKGDYRICQ